MKITERIGWLILFYLVTAVVLLIAPESHGQKSKTIASAHSIPMLKASNVNQQPVER